MKAHRIFGFNEVQEELGLALIVSRFGELVVSGSRGLGVFDVSNQVDYSIHGNIAKLEGPILDGVDAFAKFLLGPFVAGLTGAVDVEERAANMVIADFVRAFARVGHVAIGAGNAGARVNALAP